MITANSVEKVSQAHYIAIGSQSGAIEVHELIFTNVNSIYRDRYAYCDGMTDVIVQNLSSSDKVRIKCREVIKKVALYKNKFAVLLSERLLIYEVGLEDENDMRYRMKEKVNLKVDCDHMVITSHHVIFSMEKKMQCYNFQGLREREWIMDSQVRSVKVIGGPPNQEGILVGMKSGQVLQIFITNAFPVTLIEQSLALKSLDISCDRRQLAVIDESNTLHVYDINSKQRIYQEPDATSVVWNATIPELLCYSGKEMLSIKAGNFPPRTQHMKGEVIGYVSSRVHCLVGYRASTIEVPQSTAMYQYMEQRRYQEAYNIACEGVSWSDWSALASAALNDLQLDVARKAFERLRDYHHLRLLVTLEERQKRLGGNLKQNANEREVCMGDILAHEGEFTEAAKSYRRGNAEEKAMHMYSALRLFDQAKEFANKSAPEEKKKLITQQAEWASNTNDKRAAAQMYLEAGEVGKAVEIMGLCGWTDMLIEVARTQDAADRKILERCAFYLNRLGQYPYAAECYSKMGDITSLVNLHVTARHWEEAFAIVKKHSQFKAQVYKPYAQYLAENDKFEEAQAAFHEAGLEAEAVHVLQQLTENAVTESRFNDAAYYYWKLSMQCLSIAREDKSKQVDMINKFHQFQRKASMYYVYFSIQRYTDEPFSSHMPEALFNMSRWLLLTLGNNVPPPGISKVNILYTLAKQSRNVGAYKLARHAYDKLQTLRIPARFRDAVDVGAIALRGKPYNDSEDVLPMCYRCSNTNPLINKEGCVCVNCKEPFVYSFVSFDILPLVEFTLEAGITDEEAVELIAFDQAPKSNKLANRTDNWREDNSATAQSLRLDQLNPSGDNATEDPFSLKLLASETENGIFQPVVLDRDTLKAIPSNEIQILKWPKPLRFQYFKSIMPDISITKCYSCFQLFHTDDFELQALQKGHCPYCRNSTD